MVKDKSLWEMKADVVRQEYLINCYNNALKTIAEKQKEFIIKTFDIIASLFFLAVAGYNVYIFSVADSLGNNTLLRFLVIANLGIFGIFTYVYIKSCEGKKDAI